MKVFVGLSGGVDSSVSAGLLLRAGYDVTGVFIKVWHPDFLACNWKEERRDAMRVCAHLCIPFMEIDLSKEYKRDIVDSMIAEYSAGRTPNPDALCNKYIKFGAFLNEARSRGADFVATGHYAQIIEDKDGKHLVEGEDDSKDQSYFLWAMPSHTLERVLFPVGNLPKTKVRELAKKFKLPTATKKDSQGLCFLGPVDLKEFICHFVDCKEGDVLDESGNVIGKHDGAIIYTLGQRHGFTLTEQKPDAKPLYVISKDCQKNTITVSEQKPSVPAGKVYNLEKTNFTVPKERLINGSSVLSARIRYRAQKVPCEIKFGEGDIVQISFRDEIEDIAPGQSVVVYENSLCLGGGIVSG